MVFAGICNIVRKVGGILSRGSSFVFGFGDDGEQEPELVDQSHRNLHLEPDQLEPGEDGMSSKDQLLNSFDFDDEMENGSADTASVFGLYDTELESRLEPQDPELLNNFVGTASFGLHDTPALVPLMEPQPQDPELCKNSVGTASFGLHDTKPLVPLLEPQPQDPELCKNSVGTASFWLYDPKTTQKLEPQEPELFTDSAGTASFGLHETQELEPQDPELFSMDVDDDEVPFTNLYLYDHQQEHVPSLLDWVTATAPDSIVQEHVPSLLDWVTAPAPDSIVQEPGFLKMDLEQLSSIERAMEGVLNSISQQSASFAIDHVDPEQVPIVEHAMDVVPNPDAQKSGTCVIDPVNPDQLPIGEHAIKVVPNPIAKELGSSTSRNEGPSSSGNEVKETARGKEDAGKIHSCNENECNEKFAQKAHLVRHQRIHTGKILYLCPVCKLSFLRKPRMEMHLLTHRRHQSSKSNRACPQCSQTFTSKGALRRHEEESHGGLFTCPRCGRNLRSRHGLDIHLLWHTRICEEEFQCIECGFIFKHDKALQDHVLRVHTKFSCCHCSKKFKSESKLIRHIASEHPFDIISL